MATNKLSAKFCDTAKCGNHFDGEGLYLMVQPDGKKYWRMVCYLHGKRKLLAFGNFNKVSLSEARIKRTEAQDLLKMGIDPVVDKKNKKHKQFLESTQSAHNKENTFEQIARRLHASKDGKTSEEYRNKMLREFEIHVFPNIGNRDIQDIKGAELLALFRNIAKKTNHGRLMTYLAKTLCQKAAEVFDFAHLENDDFTSNPCRLLVKHLPSHDTKHMKRITFDKLPSFVKDLNKYNGHPLTKAAIWMMLYTGMRTKSIRYALVKDINLKELVWYRQPEKKDKFSHLIPLPTQAVSLIKQILPLTAGGPDDLLFPSIRNQYHKMSEAAVCQAIKRLKYDMVGHGLRGVVDTGLNELGFPPHIVSAQLGHKKKDKVEAAYNDAKHFDERLKMMQYWADYLEKFVT